MPIRLSSGLGSQAEAFRWAADHGADVVSCSWGPADGDWFNPADPLHNSVFPLPASTRLAIDYATNPQLGDPAGNYTNRFGGTSSACPGAAGIVALILSVNPELRRHGCARSCARRATGSIRKAVSTMRWAGAISTATVG